MRHGRQEIKVMKSNRLIWLIFAGMLASFVVGAVILMLLQR